MALQFLNDGYFAGKVGIGAPAASKKLEVTGNAGIEGTLTVETSSNNIRLLDSNDSTVNFSVGVNGKFQIRDVSAVTNPFQIEKGALSNSLYIDSAGNVGIGTASPNSKLEIKIGTDQNIGFNSNSSVARISSYNDAFTASSPLKINGSDLRFDISSSEKMRVTGTGALSFGSTGTAYGTSGQVLTSAGNASPTWTTPTTGTVTGSGTATQVAFWDTSTSLSGDSNLYWDATNQHLGLGDVTPNSKLKVVSGTSETSIYTVDINHVRNDANVATIAQRINMDLSGADTTTGDRTNYGLYLDIDSSANGDASNEHRIYGVGSTINFTGFTDIARAGYFLAESNYTVGKTAQLVGVFGHAVHDAESTDSGVSNMMGAYGTSSIQDQGDVDNAYGGFFNVVIPNSRTETVGATIGVQGEVQIDKETALTYGTMIGVSSVIDNNETTFPTFGAQYLFKGDYQGTRGGNAYGVYCEGDKHYFSNSVGIGTTLPDSTLEVQFSEATGTKKRMLHLDYNPTDNYGSAIFKVSSGSSSNNVFKIEQVTGGGNGEFGTYLDTNIVNTNASESGAYGNINFVTGTTISGSISRSIVMTIGGGSQKGNVGIGTTNPAQKFVVANATNGQGVEIIPGTTGTLQAYNRGASVYVPLNIDTLEARVRSIGATVFNNGSGFSESVRILSGGNVGIGNTNPPQKLTVNGAAFITNDLTSPGAAGTYTYNATAIDYNSDGARYWSWGGATTRGTFDFIQLENDGQNQQTALSIDVDGNVGIGTDSPENKLHVQQPALFTGIHSTAGIRVKSDGASAIGNYHGTIALSRGTGSVAISAVQEENDSDVMGMAFSTHPTTPGGDASVEKMRLDHDGNLGIGTASPGTRLEVSASATTSVDIAHFSNSNGSAKIKHTLDGVGSGRISILDAGNNEDVRLSTQSNSWFNAGNVGIGTISPTSLLEISKQLSAASTIDYPYTISSRDDGNLINQAGGEGVGIKFRIAGNAATTPGDSLVGASIAAIRESSSDTDSSTGLGFFVTQNDETLDEALRLTHDLAAEFASSVQATQIIISSAVPSILFDETDATARWRNRVQTGGYRLQYASDGSTFTDHVSLGANAFTLAKDTTFTEQAFSAATSSGDASSTLTTKGYVDGLITASTSYRGTWDPDVSLNSGYGNPNLNTVTKTSGYYYICSDIGTAHPNGTTGNPAVPCEPNSWEVGDWVVWNDDVPDCAGTGTGAWQKIDNTSVLSGIGTGQTVALWEGDSSVTDSETLGNAPITVSGSNVLVSAGLQILRTSDPFIQFYEGSTNVGDVFADTSLNNIVLRGGSSHGVRIMSNAAADNSEAGITLDTSGNVGIGTTSPSRQLDVEGVIRFSSNSNQAVNGYGEIYTTFSYGKGQIFIAPEAVTSPTNFHPNGGVTIGPANTSPPANGLIVSGNVGIGETNPLVPLHISRDSDSGENIALLLDNNDTTAGSEIGMLFRCMTGSGNTDFEIFGKANAVNDMDLVFQSDGSNERVRFTGDGNVGIGTSNPLSQLSIGSNAITTKKPTVIIADGVAGGSLVIRGLSPILSFDRTGANPENKILMDGAGLEFKTGTLDTEGDVDFKIKLDGKLQAPAYTQGFLQSDASGNIEISGGGTLPGGPFLPLVGGTMTGTNGVVFPDAFKLNLGTGSDLQIYHDSANSYIETSSSSAGDLYIKAQGTNHDLYLQAVDDILIRPQGGENGIKVHGNDSVELYFNNARRLRTTTEGIFVEGQIKIDSALLDNQENTDVDTGTETVASVAIATYTAAFFDFVIKKGLNVRSGTVYACHDGDTTPLVQFTETSTQDLGNTSDVTLSVDILSGSMRLRATTTSDDWSVKSLIRAI